MSRFAILGARTPLLVLLLAACGTPVCPNDDARALIESYQGCTEDADCTVVPMNTVVGDNTCVGWFSCDNSLRTDADLDALAAEAVDIEERQADCGVCAKAACAPDREAWCDTSTGLCDLR